VKIYHSIKEFPSDINTIVTIGTFDGVHKGHKEIVGRLNSTAKKEGLECFTYILSSPKACAFS